MSMSPIERLHAHRDAAEKADGQPSLGGGLDQAA
jgi:hypothetical protein